MKYYLIYGLFTEPTSKQGFIVIRTPDVRLPWSKKVAPAIQRLVKPWMENPKDVYWNNDRTGAEDAWKKQLGARYEWTSDEQLVPYVPPCSTSPDGEHAFTPDVEYDASGDTINCEYCGAEDPFLE